MLTQTLSSLKRLVGFPSGQPVSEPAAGAEAAERRIWIRYPSDRRTTVQPALAAAADGCAAEVRNVSQGGISLVTDRPFDRGALLSVELPSNGLSPTVVLACVVHTAAQANGRWAVGCTFARDLDDDDLEAFGAKRVRPSPPDQRNWVRFTSKTKASYRPVSVADPDPKEASVMNLSPTGIGLLVTEPFEVGRLLNLTLNSPNGKVVLNMLACVVHVTVQDDEWALGCNFIRELDESELRDLTQ